MHWQRFQGLIGVAVLLGCALLLSNNRRRIDWRLVAWGIGLQVIFAVIILQTPVGKPFFTALNTAVQRVIDDTGAGTSFVFRPLHSYMSSEHEVLEATPPASQQSPPDDDAEPDAASATPPADTLVGATLRLRWNNAGNIAPPLMNIAFWLLPTVIFFSALLAVLYHLGIMQAVIRAIAWVMQRTMGTSGAETLCMAGNIFVGQTEAPMLVRPFLRDMTRSELLAVMVGGFATIAGGVMAVYAGVLSPHIPDIAGHLMAASVMSAPAALVIAKIIYPETETPATFGTLRTPLESSSVNAVDAFGHGVTQGLSLALNIGAMLIAFIAAVSLINGLLATLPHPDVQPWSMQLILGLIFRPLAWCMGASWSESQTVGALLGEKLVLTELVAYTHLSEIPIGSQLSERTAIITSYALCGFANFASIGVQLGGIGGMAPERRGDIAAMAVKAMFGGALASWLTASIAGVLI